MTVPAGLCRRCYLNSLLNKPHYLGKAESTDGFCGQCMRDLWIEVYREETLRATNSPQAPQSSQDGAEPRVVPFRRMRIRS